MAGFGWPELLVIFVIILLLFGVGRITRIGSELGNGIKAFRKGIKGDKEEAQLDSGKNKSDNS